MHTFSKLILAAAMAAPMVAAGTLAHADSVVPQLQYPSVFWPDRDNAQQGAYAYYPDGRVARGVRVNADAAGYAAHCFYRSGARTFAPGCRY